MTTSLSGHVSAAGLNELLFGSSPARAIATPALIAAMLDSGGGISDLIFSPGRPPQVERHGELVEVRLPQLPTLRAADTAGLASDLIDGNEQVLRTLKEQGASDLSYSLGERSRFRVNVFRQRSTYAIVMRLIAPAIPSLEELNLPPAIGDVATLKNGIVLVTGTDRIRKVLDARAHHDRIQRNPRGAHLTIEDPIEFLHHTRRARSTSASSTATRRLALALRAALARRRK